MNLNARIGDAEWIGHSLVGVTRVGLQYYRHTFAHIRELSPGKFEATAGQPVGAFPSLEEAKAGVERVLLADAVPDDTAREAFNALSAAVEGFLYEYDRGSGEVPVYTIDVMRLALERVDALRKPPTDEPAHPTYGTLPSLMAKVSDDIRDGDYVRMGLCNAMNWMSEAYGERRAKAEGRSGHGHVIPNPDGSKARCGGPAICPACRAEQAAFAARTAHE